VPISRFLQLKTSTTEFPEQIPVHLTASPHRVSIFGAQYRDRSSEEIARMRHGGIITTTRAGKNRMLIISTAFRAANAILAPLSHFQHFEMRNEGPDTALAGISVF